MIKRDKSFIRGRVTAIVYDSNGLIKRHEVGRFRRLFGLFVRKIEDLFKVTLNSESILAGRPMISVNHNIVTNEGDALVADIMSQTPARTKVDNTNGYIEVGTGFVSEVKTATSCTTPTGSPEIMDASYPQQKGSFGAADDNVTVYRATFEAGDLNATGIDEAALINGATASTADCLAYAQISPSVNVTTADTLEVTWEITYLGA